MKKNRWILCAVIAALLVVPAGVSFAQPFYGSGTLTSDMAAVVSGVSELFGENLGGLSYIGDPVGYSFIKNFTLGAGVGVLLVPISSLDFAAGTTMNMNFGDLSYIPLPVLAAFAKFSLKKLEFGAKVGGFPPYTSDEFSIHNLIIGGKVRYKIGDFNLLVIKGGLSAGGLVEYMSGGISITQSEGFPIFLDFGAGDVQVGNAVTTASIDSTWKGFTVGGEAQANFQLLFLNLFIGSRLSKTFGKADAEFTGDVTLVPIPGFEGNIQSGIIPIIAVPAETRASGIDFYGFGGAEIKILILTLGMRGTYNFSNKSITVDGGLRLQF